MGESSAIEWTDHTFNPVWGCVKISPACDNCYAAAFDHRLGGEHWGPHAPLREFGDKHWAEPLKWNAVAERDGVRRRVFCASMADVFDKRWPMRIRIRLWQLIRATPHLDWLLLTKRPQNIAGMLPTEQTGCDAWGDGYPNVWLGTTVENQEEADRRIPHLLAVPARIRFLSCEPLLGPVDLHLEGGWCRACGKSTPGTIDGHCMDPASPCFVGETTVDALLHWVIAGGESGPGARPMHPDWATDLRDQCAAADVAFLFKQWGEWVPGENASSPMVRAEQTATWWNDEWSFDRVTPSQAQDGHADDEPDLYRLGKKRAGRHLDGVLHDGYPSTAA